VTVVRTAEKKLLDQPDTLSRWVVMVEGLDAETVAGACRAVISDEALARHGAAPDRSLAVYRLVYTLGD
jgi:hypothetical protein